MNKYIATFFSHFGALTYYNSLKETGISATLAPVPRNVSASCGTCVRYEHTGFVDMDDCELESIYQEHMGTVLLCHRK